MACSNATGELLRVFLLACVWAYPTYAPLRTIRQASNSERRDMLRFSIRDLLWVIALSAVAIGWWLEFRNRGPENVRLRAENNRLKEERDLANWQLESSMNVLARRGGRLERQGYSVSLRGDFTGKYSSGVTKASPPYVIPIDAHFPEKSGSLQSN